MAKQTINIGSAANDGTGTPARDAFDICNDNFTELYDGKLSLDGSTEMTGDLVFAEAADHSSTPAAGKGYLWVRSDTPSSLIFTDDAGTDYDLTDITSTPEGTAILSTGEVGGTKFLREDGDGTSSWQPIPATEGTAILSTGEVGGTKFLREDGDGTCSWQEVAGGSGAFTADAQTQITPTTPIVLDEATGDEVALQLNYTVNKATSGNDTGLLINQTDTASPGTSNLLDLQVGGTSQLRVDNSGGLYLNGPIYDIADPDQQINIGAGVWSFTDNFGTTRFRVDNSGTQVKSDNAYQFSSGNAGAASDVKLYRDAANTLALRNSTNAQTFNVYSSYTDASNYERLSVGYDGTYFSFAAQSAGTGTGRPIIFKDQNADNVLGITTDYAVIVGGQKLGFTNNTNPAGAKLYSIFAPTSTTDDLEFISDTPNAPVAFTFRTFDAGSAFALSSGTQDFLKLSPTINQSGTAGYTGIKLDVTETATGSGTNRLLDLQVASTTKFAVENDGTPIMGTHSAIGAETVTGYITIKDAAGTTRKLAVVS